jgi:hypothetical protein
MSNPPFTLEERRAKAALIGNRVVGSTDAELRLDGHIPEPPQRDVVHAGAARVPGARVIVLPSTDKYRRELDELKRGRSK